MLLIYSEKNDFSFNGTIIDIETIGDFCRQHNDSRCYRNITPTIFGYINKDALNVFCAKTESDLEELKEKIKEIFLQLKRPFYAYNCCFEIGVLFHSCGLNVSFEGDLMKEKKPGVKWEKKEEAVVELNVSKYDDPFNGDGVECLIAWQKGDLEKAIKHNRSCLLKERDILIKRGYRNPEPLQLFRRKIR